MVDLARQGLTARRSVGRLTRRPLDRTSGDIDLDASLDELVAARRGDRPADPSALVGATWERPDTAVCLLVDRSGSMHGARLAAAALAAATVALRAPTSCSVVAFAQESIVLAGQGVPREPECDRVGPAPAAWGRGDRRGTGAAHRGGTARSVDRRPPAHDPVVRLPDHRRRRSRSRTPRALDELAILAPEGDSDDAEALAAAVGARWAPVGGPTSVVDALAVALSP